MDALRHAHHKDPLLHGIPNGHLYATMISIMPELDIDAWSKIINHLISQGLVNSSNHLLTLSEKGLQVADRIAAIVDAQAKGVAK